MRICLEKRRKSLIRRILSAFIALTFVVGIVIPPQVGYAQSVLNLPVPGVMVPVTSAFTPAMIKGINLYPDNPLKFDFIIDKGDSGLEGTAFESESSKLIKYFMASLTVPENEMWVNLSPYEKNRIIPENFGHTEMGRDLLAQDYLLKQLSASLMYPGKKLGASFWDKVYSEIYKYYNDHPDTCQKQGRDPDCNVGAEIPMNTFNKIWIVPKEAKVYEHAKGAYVVRSHLNVMLEEDYLALESNIGSTRHGMGNVRREDIDVISGVSAQVVREVLIPEIEKEVNEGETFANLRQIYNSMILAVWYKQALKDSLLGQFYVDQNKTKGVDVQDQAITQKIYNQYVEAFKHGVYDYITEDYDPVAQEIIPRKYFSGGITPGDTVKEVVNREGKGNLFNGEQQAPPSPEAAIAISDGVRNGKIVTTEINPLERKDPAMAAALPVTALPTFDGWEDGRGKLIALAEERGIDVAGLEIKEHKLLPSESASTRGILEKAIAAGIALPAVILKGEAYDSILTFEPKNPWEITYPEDIEKFNADGQLTDDFTAIGTAMGKAAKLGIVMDNLPRDESHNYSFKDQLRGSVYISEGKAYFYDFSQFRQLDLEDFDSYREVLSAYIGFYSAIFTDVNANIQSDKARVLVRAFENAYTQAFGISSSELWSIVNFRETKETIRFLSAVPEISVEQNRVTVQIDVKKDPLRDLSADWYIYYGKVGEEWKTERIFPSEITDHNEASEVNPIERYTLRHVMEVQEPGEYQVTLFGAPAGMDPESFPLGSGWRDWHGDKGGRNGAFTIAAALPVTEINLLDAHTKKIWNSLELKEQEALGGFLRAHPTLTNLHIDSRITDDGTQVASWIRKKGFLRLADMTFLTARIHSGETLDIFPAWTNIETNQPFETGEQLLRYMENIGIPAITGSLKKAHTKEEGFAAAEEVLNIFPKEGWDTWLAAVGKGYHGDNQQKTLNTLAFHLERQLYEELQNVADDFDAIKEKIQRLSFFIPQENYNLSTALTEESLQSAVEWFADVRGQEFGTVFNRLNLEVYADTPLWNLLENVRVVSSGEGYKVVFEHLYAGENPYGSSLDPKEISRMMSAYKNASRDEHALVKSMVAHQLVEYLKIRFGENVQFALHDGGERSNSGNRRLENSGVLWTVYATGGHFQFEIEITDFAVVSSPVKALPTVDHWENGRGKLIALAEERGIDVAGLEIKEHKLLPSESVSTRGILEKAIAAGIALPAVILKGEAYDSILTFEPKNPWEITYPEDIEKFNADGQLTDDFTAIGTAMGKAAKLGIVLDHLPRYNKQDYQLRGPVYISDGKACFYDFSQSRQLDLDDYDSYREMLLAYIGFYNAVFTDVNENIHSDKASVLVRAFENAYMQAFGISSSDLWSIANFRETKETISFLSAVPEVSVEQNRVTVQIGVKKNHWSDFSADWYIHYGKVGEEWKTERIFPSEITDHNEASEKNPVERYTLRHVMEVQEPGEYQVTLFGAPAGIDPESFPPGSGWRDWHGDKGGRNGAFTIAASSPLTAEDTIFKTRRSGELLHFTSLPSVRGRRGTIGQAAYDYVDYLESAGQTIWQVLPTGPTQEASDNSPYEPLSPFAHSELLVDPDLLVKWGLLTREFLEDLDKQTGLSDREFNKRFLDEAYKNYQSGDLFSGDFDAYNQMQASWLDNYALFTAIRYNQGKKFWVEWSDEYKRPSHETLERFRKQHRQDIERIKFEQFLFAKQMKRLKTYANQHGVALLGDIAIFLSHNSDVVWTHPEWFDLNDDGTLRTVAGLPATAFNETGQRWGNPLYLWDKIQEDNFQFWIDRLGKQLEFFDFVRMDHFPGFFSYWSLLADEEDATKGEWIKAPGTELFKTLKKAFPEYEKLPIIVDDLEAIDKEVLAIRDGFGLPGMKMGIFAFNQENSPYLPKNYGVNNVSYSGTHDTLMSRTALQQWKEDPEKAQVLERAQRYFGEDVVTDEQISWAMIAMSMNSEAVLSIIPAQETLKMGEEGTMNKPGTGAIGGNWSFQFTPETFAQLRGQAAKLRQLTEMTGRTMSDDPRSQMVQSFNEGARYHADVYYGPEDEFQYIIRDRETDVPFMVSTEQRLSAISNPAGEKTAAASASRKGGIDLNPNEMDLQLEGSGPEMMPVTSKMIEHLRSMNIEGFEPVIINVAPIANFLSSIGRQI